VWACNGVYTKKILVGLEPFLIVLYQTLLAGPLFLVEAALWDPQMVTHLDWRIIAALIYQGLITTAIGFIAWNTMLRRYGAVALHSFIFIMPVTGVLLGGMILKEPITSNIGIAMVLVAAGIMVVNSKPRRETTMVYPGRNV
jgi:drug/metabolite transporter (DMT)-like permease